jgi:predicted helicase
VYSMDATEVYGKVAYKLPFRQAVDEGLICDYEVLISVVTNAEINDWVLSHGEVLVKGDLVKARQVANQVALMNAISGHNISKIITFHSSVASAKSFTSPGGEGINSMVMNLIALHVNGSMPAAKRSAVMREFERSEFLTLISNARCMIEGVDVPAVDMVAFLSPKKSKVDIVQATGRAMRLSDNKKVGYLLVPLYLEQGVGESIDEAVERADFGEVWNVLQAMKEQDEELDDVIKVIQEERGKTGGYDDSRLTERIEVLGPALNLATLRNAVVTSCVERLGDTWDLRFGELVAYKKEHGDCNVPQSYSKNPQLAFWVNTQRTHHKKGYLQPKRISRLEEIGFDWDPKDSEWEQRFSELVSYKDEYGHCNVPRGYAENPQLGTWVKVQRRS